MARARWWIGVVVVVVAGAVLVATAAARSGDRGAAGPGSVVPSARPGAAASLRVTGTLSDAVDVGPAPGGALDGIDRDAGISVPLRDGSTLWLFGDTARPVGGGALAYFVIGTASWAPPGRPTRTEDVAVRAEPVRFATPGVDFPACPPEAPVPGLWPASAVAVPVGARDRVVVWLENVCLGRHGAGVGRGMAVAEWWYEPGVTDPAQPIRATILNPRLAPARWFGLASFVDRDGSIVVYACDERGVAPAGGPAGTAPACRVARVAPDDVTRADTYRVWDGSDWVPGGAAPGAAGRAAPMAMPARRGADGAPVEPVPPGSVSVARDMSSGRYVMAYSPWPAWSDEIEVRVAAHPWGPWSRPVPVPLPGCDDVVDGRPYRCYAANLQPSLAGRGRLGLGWYDRVVDPVVLRGSFRTASVPVAIG